LYMGAEPRYDWSLATHHAPEGAAAQVVVPFARTKKTRKGKMLLVASAAAITLAWAAFLCTLMARLVGSLI
jgi:hypothetical protein